MSTTLTPEEVYSLLSKLCIDLGFCLPPDQIARLQSDSPDDPDRFTDAVFLVEGLDPKTSDRALRRQVRGLVTEAFERAKQRAPDLTRSQQSLRGKNVRDMTAEELHDWLDACEKMEIRVKPAKARRSWKSSGAAARAKLERRGIS
jgi:hypothetical protein